MSDVTSILDALGRGEPRAAGELLPLVYDELRRLAARRLAGEVPGQTLDATALVHEAYLRLVGGDPGRPWQGRAHFFAAAAESMRRILVENARRKRRIRHGGGLARAGVEPDEIAAPEGRPSTSCWPSMRPSTASPPPIPTAAELVKLRYFAGLSIAESAEILGVSPRTADRLWTYARAWLRREIEPE